MWCNLICCGCCCYCFNSFLIEPKCSRVNFYSFWRGPSTEAASLYTYLRTGKWDAPPGLSGAPIPRAENVNILGLSDPELSQRLISPTNLPLPFSPFSIPPLLQPLIFPCSAFSSFPCSPLLFLSLFQMGARQPSALSSTAVCPRRWVAATKVERGAGRRVTYLYQKSNFTCLDLGWFLK